MWSKTTKRSKNHQIFHVWQHLRQHVSGSGHVVHTKKSIVFSVLFFFYSFTLRGIINLQTFDWR